MDTVDIDGNLHPDWFYSVYSWCELIYRDLLKILGQASSYIIHQVCCNFELSGIEF